MIIYVIRQGLHDNALAATNNCRSPLAQRIIDHTSVRLQEALQRHGLNIPGDKIYLVHGEPAIEIKKLAKKLAVDLVIVGSRSKDADWMRLPGATTNCVLQGITSDVMAIKL